MAAQIREIARLKGHSLKLVSAMGAVALMVIMVLLGMPALAGGDLPSERETPSGPAAGPSKQPGPQSTTPLLYELITAPVVDTYIDQYDGTRDTDHSAEPTLRLRRAHDGEAVVLLHFDLGGIPPEAEIESVELEMHVVYSRPSLSVSNTPGMSLYRLSRPWCADADWSRACQSATWCQPGASGTEDSCPEHQDRDSEHIPARISMEEGLFKLRQHAARFEPLAQWVQSWVSHETANNGLLLALTRPVPDVQHIDFAGTGYFGFPEASAPLLKVVYRVPMVPGYIHGMVWTDTNHNGLREQALGETPMPGVLVRLARSDNTILLETRTDSHGEYLFAQVLPDDYYLLFEPPPGFLFSVQDVGYDDTIDSDANPGTSKTDVFTLPSGGQQLSWDAGLYKQGALLWFPLVGVGAAF